MPEGMRCDRLGDPGSPGYPVNDPRRGVAVEAAAVGWHEYGSLAAFPDGQVDGAGGARGEGNGDGLAAFTHDGEGAMPAFETEGFDVGAAGFGDPQPVEGQQRDQGVVGGPAQPAATSKAPTSLRSRPTAWDS
jgi:hypothetical protein